MRILAIILEVLVNKVQDSGIVVGYRSQARLELLRPRKGGLLEYGQFLSIKHRFMAAKCSV